MKIEWLPDGEDNSIPRCPNCGLSGPELSDIASHYWHEWFCDSCKVLLEVE